MTSKITFDHCVIHVKDWDRSNAFYRNILGAEIVSKQNGFSYRFGSVQLNCHGPNQIGQPLAQLPVLPGGSDLCFEWHGSVEDATQYLASNNVAIEIGPVERTGAKGSGTSLYFRDPDGSLIEFICYNDL